MNQKKQWLPTITLFLFLYPVGWLISHFFYVFNKEISSNDLSIIGTIITFFLFLIILPSWGRSRWKTNNLWFYIGLDFKNKLLALKFFIIGLIWSAFILSIYLIFLFCCGWIDNFNFIDLRYFLNALILVAGIVFVEEIIFRGWLLEEMVLLFGLKRGIFFQSAIFSLAHYRSDISLIALITFFIGLFLFGIVLTIRRVFDKGKLWGSIGLHGGLVGIWYLFYSGMVTFSDDIPYYFLGPSKDMVNPIGSFLGIIILLIILLFQRRLFLRTGRFLASTVSASFKDEIP